MTFRNGFFTHTYHLRTPPKGKNGNTAFHEIVLHAKNLAEIDRFIIQMGEHRSQEMARTINNEGELPFDLINQSNLHFREKFALIERFYFLFSLQPITSITDQLAVCNYPNNCNDELKVNLQLAYEIVNELRTKILYSATHPQFNDYSSERRESNLKLIAKIREEKSYYSFKQPWLRLLNIYRIVKETQAANCQEYSEAAMYLLIKYGYAHKAHIFHIDNGDHVFVIIDDAYYYNETQHVFSANAVLLDAWSGNVFPIYEMPFKLQDCRMINDIRVLIPFNGAFHRLSQFIMDIPIILADKRRLEGPDINECLELKDLPLASTITSSAVYR